MLDKDAKKVIVETVEVQVCGGCYNATGIANRKLPGTKWNSYGSVSLPPENSDETRKLERINCLHIGGGGFLGVPVWAYGVWRVAS